MKKCMIIGGNGFLGNALAKRLQNNYEITIVDRYFSRESAGFNYIIFDLQSDRIPCELKNNFSLIINCASTLGVQRVMDNPLSTLINNYRCAYNGLKIAEAQTNLEKYLYFSTSEVFGTEANNSDENSDFVIGKSNESRWSYATSKVFGEQLTFSFGKKNKIPVMVIRPFNIYGPGRGKEGAINHLLSDALNKHQVWISGNGEQTRAWCYVDDFVNGVELCINKGKSGESYNIGNPTELYSLNATVQIIKRLTGLNIKIKNTVLEQDVKKRVPNISKAQGLGYSPVINLNNGIRNIIDDQMGGVI